MGKYIDAWVSLAVVCTLTVAGVGLLAQVHEPAVTVGGSMMPTMNPDPHWTVADKLVYLVFEPQRGDIVLIDPSWGAHKRYVKRIIGLPGDTVEIRDGWVYINGWLLEEPYQPYRDSSWCAPLWIPPDHYFVLGDNRANSYDSRQFGLVARDWLVGKVYATLWPPDQWDWYLWPVAYRL